MTNKQIIIDGVPVQDCCYFDYENDGYEDSCYIHQNECSAQNCYFKQLTRKTQECEELERLYKELQDDMLSCNKCRATIKLQQQLDQLKAENKKLKERLNSRCFDPKSNNNRCISYNRIAEDYERDLKQIDQLKVENEI